MDSTQTPPDRPSGQMTVIQARGPAEQVVAEVLGYHFAATHSGGAHLKSDPPLEGKITEALREAGLLRDRPRLKAMNRRELRKLVKHLERCLADYDGDPAVQHVIHMRRKENQH